MSENPYQPSQVEQKVSGQSIGLRRILAISAANRSYAMNWRFYGFRWQAICWVMIPLVLCYTPLVLYMWLLFPDYSDHIWLIFALMAPWFIFSLLASWNGGVVLGSRHRDQTPPQDIVNTDGLLFASGQFSLKESAANYNRIMRFINRILTGRSPTSWFIRVPCLLFEFSPPPASRPNPFDDEDESEPQEGGSNPDDDIEYWYAAGKLDLHKEPELVYQHLGFNSDPAVKIYYFDEQQRPMWLVLASPDAGYLQQTLATLPQSFMITLGN